jgi:EAL domain-containing protein (putative c-di-GMP-specific phosphodiesterase class I)
MYKAKKSGKNRAIFYDNALQNEADKLLSLRGEIRDAVENYEFIMYYQAQYDIEGINILGYEALIRWDHPVKGIIQPSEFIPYLEQLDLSLEIDKYVLKKVSSDLENKILLKDTRNISVNISAKSFEDSTFVSFLKEVIEDYKLDPSRITLEITEDTLMKNIKNNFIKDIKALNFKISIDDFGTGYSSLAYISSMEFDEVNLDMTFVQAISKSKRDEQICKFILHMFRELDVNIVAEGVETQEQLEFVRREGANIIQGYLHSKPKPLN